MKWFYNPPSLRPAREAVRLTRRAVAERLQRTEEFVYTCERGKSIPSAGDLAGFASLYGVSPEAFFLDMQPARKGAGKEKQP
jgi:transcriptional regulator with XRE-family HTH domain